MIRLVREVRGEQPLVDADRAPGITLNPRGPEAEPETVVVVEPVVVVQPVAVPVAEQDTQPRSAVAPAAHLTIKAGC